MLVKSLTPRQGRARHGGPATVEEILATAGAHTAQTAAGRHVLLIEDTSEINYQAKSGRKSGLGRVGNGTDVGLFVHPALAIDAADGTILGLAGAKIWCRHKAKRRDYQEQAIETKESYRWLETITQARAELDQSPLVSAIADREADIYELFARLPEGAGPCLGARGARPCAGGRRSFVQETRRPARGWRDRLRAASTPRPAGACGAPWRCDSWR